MKIFKLILAGVITVALAFCGGWIWGSWRAGHKTKPAPTPTPVPIVNPQPDKDSPNQVIVNIGGHGTTETLENRATTTKPDPEVIVTPTPQPGTAVPLNKTLPVKGQITAKFVNKKDGAELGVQTQPLTGSATISGDASDFQIALDFTSQLIFGINIPEEPKKLWRLGLHLATDFDEVAFGGYGQKDFKLTTIRDKADILGFVRVEFDYDQRIMGGIELNF